MATQPPDSPPFKAFCCGQPMIASREGNRWRLVCATGTHGRWFTVSDETSGESTCSCWSGRGQLDVADLGAVRLYQCRRCGARYTVFIESGLAEAEVYGVSADEVAKVGRETLSGLWDALYNHRLRHASMSKADVERFVNQVKQEVAACSDGVPANDTARELIELMDTNLRSLFFEQPSREREIQDAVETLFRARGIDYSREKVAIEYSATSFVPDFTVESASLAVEVKLCNSADRQSRIVNEINADIPAYQTRYEHCAFIVYDLGFIRDVARFRSSIEGNPGVYVLVVKH